MSWVIPAKAGIHEKRAIVVGWIPAYAGMTQRVSAWAARLSGQA